MDCVAPIISKPQFSHLQNGSKNSTCSDINAYFSLYALGVGCITTLDYLLDSR